MITQILPVDLVKDQIFSIDGGSTWFTCAGVPARATYPGAPDITVVPVYADLHMRDASAPTVELRFTAKAYVTTVAVFLRLEGEYGNVFMVLAQVTTVLRTAGVPVDMISALRNRVTTQMSSYDEVIALLQRTIIAE